MQHHSDFCIDYKPSPFSRVIFVLVAFGEKTEHLLQAV